MKIETNQTVAQVIKQIAKRNPLAQESDNFSLFLPPKTSSDSGIWLDESRTLESYNLVEKDLLELKKKPNKPSSGSLRKGSVTSAIVYSTEQGTKAKINFESSTLVKDALKDACTQLHTELDRQYGLLYNSQLLDNDRTLVECGIYNGDTLSLKPRDLPTEDVSGMIKIEATVSIPGKAESAEVEIVDRADVFVFEVKQKIVHNLKLENADEYELYLAGSRLYDESLLADEMWLREDGTLLSYTDFKEVVVQLRPRRKKRNEPKKEENDPFADIKDDSPIIWDEPSNESNLRLSPDGKTVVAGTLNKLVERLTAEKEHDLMFMKVFILTYQSFTTPEMLLYKLLQRYPITLKCLRVVNALKTWLDLSFSDFDQDTRLFGKLNDFVDITLVNDGNAKLQTKLRDFIMRKLSTEKDRKKVFTTPAPAPKIPRNLNSADFNFLDLDDEEIARQLTLIEYETFAIIKPAELLNQAWAKAALQKRAPNILSMIERFNNVSLWVASMILKVDNLRIRTKMMTKCINIAKQLQKLNNFSTMMAFIAGLNNAAVSRLALTKQELSSRTVEDLASLEQLMSAQSSYKAYREALHTANPPLITYLGVYLSDITFIEDGNPDMLGGLINFQKRELVSKVIIELQTYQHTPYNLSTVPKIASLLKRLPTKTEKELYQLSLVIEPRK